MYYFFIFDIYIDIFVDDIQSLFTYIHIYKDFYSVSDHFTALQSKGLTNLNRILRKLI